MSFLFVFIGDSIYELRVWVSFFVFDIFFLIWCFSRTNKNVVCYASVWNRTARCTWKNEECIIDIEWKLKNLNKIFILKKIERKEEKFWRLKKNIKMKIKRRNEDKEEYAWYTLVLVVKLKPFFSDFFSAPQRKTFYLNDFDFSFQLIFVYVFLLLTFFRIHSAFNIHLSPLTHSIKEI